MSPYLLEQSISCCSERLTKSPDWIAHAPSIAPVAEKLQQHKEEFGLSEIVAEINLGGLIPYEGVVNSIKLLADRVMPKLK